MDDIQADSQNASVEMVLRTLLRGIQTGLLNPSNARQLWDRIKPDVLDLQANDNALLNSAVLNTAILSLSNILARLSSSNLFTETQIEQVKFSID